MATPNKMKWNSQGECKLRFAGSVIAALLVVAMSAVCLRSAVAAEAEEDIWSDRHFRGGRSMEMTPEHMDAIVKYLSENEPELADKFKKLREEDPETFAKELRELAKKRMAQRAESQRGPGAGEGPRSPGGPADGGKPEDRGGPEGERPRGPETRGGQGNRSGMSRERMEAEHDEYIQWLEKNYVEEAAELAEVKEKNPDGYTRRFWLSKRRYGMIMETEKNNPKLAEVLKEDLALQQSRDKILRRIKGAEEKEQKTLIAALSEIVERRFDLVVIKKQLRYEELRERLEKLRKEVEEQQSEVEKLKERKIEETKKRIKELIERTEKVNWSTGSTTLTISIHSVT